MSNTEGINSILDGNTAEFITPFTCSEVRIEDYDTYNNSPAVMPDVRVTIYNQLMEPGDLRKVAKLFKRLANAMDAALPSSHYSKD